MTLRFYVNGSTTPSTPEALGIESATLSLLSMAADQLRLSTVRSVGASPLAYGDTLRMSRVDADGKETVVFAGRVTSVRQAADPLRHAQDILVLGPWADLERVVYKQPATFYDVSLGETVRSYASRVILSGRNMTVAQVIADIVGYAAGVGMANLDGVPIISGVTMILPRDEQDGLTCAGAIQRLLRFMPDCTVRFDYTLSPPRLIVSRPPEDRVPYGLEGAAVSAVSVEPLRDRAIERVEIEVYKTHDVDGSQYVTMERLSYPEGPWTEGASCVNTLSVPMEMDGRAVAYERARIESEDIPAILDAPLSLEARNWLKLNIEDLTKNIFDWPDDVGVTYETRRFLRFDDDGLPVYEDKSGQEALTAYPKMALTAIPHWVDETADATITVRFPKKKDAVTIDDARYDFSETESEVYTLRFTACFKSSGDYRRTASSQAAEICPPSLPYALWKSWHTVFAEGSLSLWLDDARALPKVGDLIAGYPGEPEETLSLVQGVTLSDTGLLEITVGPPEHLSPHDLVELLRGFRTRRPATHASDQEDGLATSENGINTGAASARRSSGKAPALTTKMAVYGSDDKTKKVTIDPQILPEASSEAALREVQLLVYHADDRTLRQTKAYVLATEPTGSGEPIDIGHSGESPDPGEDGDTFTPSQRREGADYQDDFYRVYLDFTSEKTGQVTQGTIDIRGPRGPQGIQGPPGTFNPGTAMSVTVVTGVTYDTSTHKLKMTKRTIQFYGTSAGTESTQDIATATPHSGEH